MTHLIAKRGALLSEVIVGAAVVCLTIGLQSAPAQSSGRTAEQAPAAAGSCRKGSVAARIGGKRRCLRAGQRCKKRFERQYRRHGFHCQAGRLRKLRKHPHPPPPPPPPPPIPPPPPLNGTGGLHSIRELALLGRPDGAALGFGSYWVRTDPGYDLFRFDTSTGQVAAHIEGLSTAPFAFSQYVAAGEGAIWASNINAGSVTRIDPATNRIVTTIPVWPVNSCGPDPSISCSSPTAIAFTPGAVWVILHHEWAVVRIDPVTNTVVATVSLGSGPLQGPQELTAANGFVYAGGSSGLGGPASLARIDPATNVATPMIDVANGCDAKAGSGTHVWLAAGVTGCGPGLPASLLDIDTVTGSVAGSVALDSSPYALAAGWGSVWALTDKLSRVDPVSHTVTGTIQLPAGQSYVAADAQQLWLAVRGGVYQIGQ
jgi:hypothetical protein